MVTHTFVRFLSRPSGAGEAFSKIHLADKKAASFHFEHMYEGYIKFRNFQKSFICNAYKYNTSVSTKSNYLMTTGKYVCIIHR